MTHKDQRLPGSGGTGGNGRGQLQRGCSEVTAMLAVSIAGTVSWVCAQGKIYLII